MIVDDDPHICELVNVAELHLDRSALSIVRKIVELHHGTMKVKSVPGEGTTFGVALHIAFV